MRKGSCFENIWKVVESSGNVQKCPREKVNKKDYISSGEPNTSFRC